MEGVGGHRVGTPEMGQLRVEGFDSTSSALEVKMKIKDAYSISSSYPMFYHREEGGLVIFSYRWQDPTVFSDYPLSRELRGIVFDKESGEIVARPFPKFFNFGEVGCAVSSDNVVSANEKIDGSLVTAFIHDSEVRFASKGSLKSWVVQKSEKLVTDRHQTLIYELYDRRFTPIFELIDTENPVVIEYPRSELIFIGARNIDNGDLLTPEEIEEIGKRYDVPFTRVRYRNVRVKEIKKVIDDQEGADNQRIAKIKTGWYIRLNKFNPQNLSEKAIIQAFFDQTLDDIYPGVPETSRKTINTVVEKINEGIQRRIQEVREFFKSIDVSEMNRKDFAMTVIQNTRPEMRGVFFAVYDGQSIEEAVFQHSFKKKEELFK
jgi:RNA ligase